MHAERRTETGGKRIMTDNHEATIQGGLERWREFARSTAHFVLQLTLIHGRIPNTTEGRKRTSRCQKGAPNIDSRPRKPVPMTRRRPSGEVLEDPFPANWNEKNGALSRVRAIDADRRSTLIHRLYTHRNKCQFHVCRSCHEKHLMLIFHRTFQRKTLLLAGVSVSYAATSRVFWFACCIFRGLS